MKLSERKKGKGGEKRRLTGGGQVREGHPKGQRWRRGCDRDEEIFKFVGHYVPNGLSNKFRSWAPFFSGSGAILAKSRLISARFFVFEYSKCLRVSYSKKCILMFWWFIYNWKVCLLLNHLPNFGQMNLANLVLS